MRTRKFKIGPKFRSTKAAVAWVLAGNWCFWGNRAARPKHPLVIQNMSLSVIHGSVMRGTLRKAVRTEA